MSGGPLYKPDCYTKSLPQPFQAWFVSRQWNLREHQAHLIEQARCTQDSLLVAPTGGGKTLAGFLPSLIELAGSADAHGLHTLYLSPLKALAVDIARNLQHPCTEMDLPIRIETRTGDTPAAKRERQRHTPPDILLTTPEQLALMLSHPWARHFFSNLKCVILDELHALVTSKRGDLLSLGLARLRALAPAMRITGLSATVANIKSLQGYISKGNTPDTVALIEGAKGAAPTINLLQSQQEIPWSGHMARYAYKEVYAAIKSAKTALVFTNTRAQAEILFSELWKINNDNLAIALHHGSLDVGQRRKVEAAMVAGTLQAVICTSTLDLGIDWGDVDLVIQIGAPKGAARLVQRIGRANHQLHVSSQALLVPSNRFEVLECHAARLAVEANTLDNETDRLGGMDVLAQHIWGRAAAEEFTTTELYEEVTSAYPYSHLTYDSFLQVLNFVSTGGYALQAYDRYKRIVPTPDGKYKIRDARSARQYRLNVGTIVEAPNLTVRLARIRKGQDGKPIRPSSYSGKKLGTIEEWFIDHLSPGDTFLFSGQVLRFEAVVDMEAYVSRAEGAPVKIPSWAGGKFPLSTHLAKRVRKIIATPGSWSKLPMPVQEWLMLQNESSTVPKSDELLIETFPHKGRYFLVCYPFEGRLAHQSLGMLLTKRLERAGLQPLGFCPTEYALSVYCRKPLDRVDMTDLFNKDMLGDDLESWLAEAALMKRTFRDCSLIAGLIERRHPGQEKSGRQVTFSTDLIYDVLKEHEPDHILLQAAWQDAASGFLDLQRLGDMLIRVENKINHKALEHVSPLAVPVMLEIGRETVPGGATEHILAELEEQLLNETAL
ncbi:MAG: ligase-associated DNA damage response DEXH box helicase [bacterium]